MIRQEKMIIWTEPNQWMVVKDLNGDGIINSGREVVGNQMLHKNGTKPAEYYPSKTFDINHDGVVDSTDNSGLAFWTDRNHNGLTDAGELKSLFEMGVTSLTLNDPTKPYAPTVEVTNTIIQETTFTHGVGEGIMRDVLFRYENTSTNTEIQRKAA